MEQDRHLDDTARRTQIRALIDGARSQAAGCMLAAESRPSPSSIDVPHLGPDYEVIGEIHRGGQGVVFRARHCSTGRTVAVKMMRDGPFGRPEDHLRFEREVHVLGQLNHPNIVGIQHSGTAAGSAYFVMDLIDGRPLDAWISELASRSTERRTMLRDILRLFVKICEAVNAAHLRGVIHRDLKPNNVLVDAAGEPHVLDFGLAKIDSTDAAPSGVTTTADGRFIGSLPWASPEQAAGSSREIDIRTDVYSLGVLLFQALTGRFPVTIIGSMRDVLDRIMTAEPPRPSTVHRDIDDDLDTIVLKCLAKEPVRRYQSAGELARDLQHFLADEPIEARRDSAWYVIRKTLRRHKRRVAAAASFLLIAMVGAVVLSVLYAKQGVLLVEVAKQRDKSMVAEKLADVRFRQAEYASYVANIAAAAAAIAANDGGVALKRLQSTPAELRNWEWRYLIGQADESVATWQGPRGLICGRVRISPDNRYIGASFWMESRTAVLGVWPRSSSSAKFAELNGTGIVTFEFSADGKQLLVGDSPEISRFAVEEIDEWELTQFAACGSPSAIELTYDGRMGLFAEDREYSVWDIAAHHPLFELPATQRMSIAKFDDRGGLLALGFPDGTVSLWSVEKSRELDSVQAHEGPAYGLAFSPNGPLLASSGGESGDLKLWELMERPAPPTDTADDDSQLDLRMNRELKDGTQRIGLISFSHDGRLLAAPSEDKAVRIWSIDDDEPMRKLLGHTTGVVCVGFSADGRWLVSGAREGVVKLWDLQRTPAVRAFRGLPGPVNSFAFTSDGARLVLNCGAAHVVDRATGKRLFENSLLRQPLQGVLPGPGTSQITLGSADGAIHIWDVGAEQQTRTIGAHQSAPSLASNPTGRVLVSADSDAVVMWDWASARQRHRFAGPGKPLRCLALNHDASRIALGLACGEVLMLDAESGRTLPLQRAEGGSITSVAFSSDGRYLAIGSDDQTVKLQDVASGQLLWRVSLDLGDVWCVAFSPDGTRLAAGGRDRSVRLLDVRNGQELLALRGPTGTVMCLAFSPDGQTIAAGTWAREVFLWRADPWESD